jgi:predicted flavoprotein YhiN
MATGGGVRLEEVNRKTMESRIIPDLYFCGELLDIDGNTGGYNIQFALSSGFLAGNSLRNYP